MHDAVRDAIRSDKVSSAHDLAEGGLLVALAECAIGGAHQLGARVKLESASSRLDVLLFGESQSRALLTAPSDSASELLARFESHGVPARRIGSVGGNRLVVDLFGGVVPQGASSHVHLNWDVPALHQVWARAFDSYLA